MYFFNKLHCGKVCVVVYKERENLILTKKEKLFRDICRKSIGTSFYYNWILKMLKAVVVCSLKNVLLLRLNLFRFNINILLFLCNFNILIVFPFVSKFDRFKYLRKYKCLYLKRLKRKFFVIS